MAKQAAAKKPAATNTADGELVHCYRLIFQVDPGGSRKAESYVASTLAEAQRAARDDLESGPGAYHALYYGEEIFLQCWEGNKRVASIDLHPYIEYRISGHPEPLRFKPGEDTILEMDEDDETMDAMLDEQLTIKVTLDWDKIQLPTLEGRPLREGETIELERGRNWAHGFHEHWDDKLPT